MQYARTLDMLARHLAAQPDVSAWRQPDVAAIAAGFGLGGAESYPGVFGDFGGFADDARLDGGYLTLSDRPGIGFEGQARLYRIMKELAAWRAPQLWLAPLALRRGCRRGRAAPVAAPVVGLAAPVAGFAVPLAVLRRLRPSPPLAGVGVVGRTAPHGSFDAGAELAAMVSWYF